MEDIENKCHTYCSNDHFNITLCSEQDYVECDVTKRLLDEKYLIPVTVIMVMIFFCGVIGNVCVCVVIGKQFSRTITNYYLFSLAVSDLLQLIFGLPIELWNYWYSYPDPFGEFVCQLRIFVIETTTYASVLTVVAFSIERYVAICHPFHSPATSGLKRTLAAIFMIWLFSMMCAVPMTKGSKVVPWTQFPPGSNTYSDYSRLCTLTNEADLQVYLITISVLFFFVAMGVLALIYIKIGFSIRSRITTTVYVESRVSSNSTEQDKAVIKLLIAVVIAFFICWAPFHFQRIFNSIISEKVKGVLFIVTGILYYLAASINPILYNVISKRYREAFKEIFFERKRRSNPTIKKPTIFLTQISKTSSTKSTSWQL